MATFSCRKCSLLFPSYAVCFSHLLDTPAHEIDRAAATAESGRRGFRSAIEGMMTIMIPADAALTRATIVAGRDAIEDQADPVPRPLAAPAGPNLFSARVNLRFMRRYTAHPAPAMLRATYHLLVHLPVEVPAPTFSMLMTAIRVEFEAQAGQGLPEIWWGLLGDTATATVWTAEKVVRAMPVRTDGGVRRMLHVAVLEELHGVVLGEEE